MTRSLTILLFVCFMIAQGFSQEQPDFSQMLDKALVLNIKARLVSKSNQAAWTFSVQKVTIPGKAIVVQMNGRNLKLNLTLTPYQEENQTAVLLVAQGQIWIQEVSSGVAKYVTNLRTIPVNLGEKIQYYPLGVGDSQDYAIELEIEIITYKAFQEQSKDRLPEATPAPSTPP
ncbi:MAG: hypothetical protein EHM28_01340, partial [Spirochaetaceae bacterium]